MKIVYKDPLSNIEYIDHGEWHRTILAIETLRPANFSKSNSQTLYNIFTERNSLDLPFTIKKSVDIKSFLENLKSVYLIINHTEFKLRLSIYNRISNDGKLLVGGVLKVLARHDREYNKHPQTDAILFDEKIIVPDIVQELINCKVTGSVKQVENRKVYTNGGYKLITEILPRTNIEDIISFYPTTKHHEE